MKRLHEQFKIDVALVSQGLNNTNATGKYMHMGMMRQGLFALLVGAMAASTTAKIELLQAVDEDGTNAKGIPTTVGQEAVATITANNLVTAASLTVATVVAGNVVTINGVTFTAAASADASNKKFAVGANNTECATSLAAVINAANIGIKATSSGAVVTVKATHDFVKRIEGTTITITNPSATITVATTEAIAYVELDVSSLDINNGFEYVATKVTTTANTTVAVNAIMGNGRFSPVQAVGASATV